MTDNERLQLLGALLTKSVNNADELPEPLRGLVQAASEAMSKEQEQAQYKLFDESGISGFTVGLYSQNSLASMVAMFALARDEDEDDIGEWTDEGGSVTPADD